MLAMKRWQGIRLDCKRNPIGILGTILVSFLIAGCTPTFTVPLSATVDHSPEVSRIPLAVGVYYSPEFRAYIATHVNHGSKWIVPLGQASVTLFDQVFPILFDRTLPSPGRPPLKAVEPALVAVIEPSIEESSFSDPFFLPGIFTAEIIYRFVLFSFDGNPIASWTVRGVSEKYGEWIFDLTARSRWLGEAADLAMQDAAQKFLVGFRDIPEVRRWFRKIGVPDAGQIRR